ncbi:MAG: hypothetical protein VKK42_14150 [Lyngbya sp.]|nr:hypothetical protein [Lyngbya sp.]
MSLDLHPEITLTSVSDWLASVVPFSGEYQPGTWVKLRELPNPYSHDEALLLAQNSENQWVAWIPDHGETILDRHQFFR